MRFGVFFEHMGVGRRRGTKNTRVIKKRSSYYSRQLTKGQSKHLRAKMRVGKILLFHKRKLVEKCKHLKAFIERTKQKNSLTS